MNSYSDLRQLFDVSTLFNQKWIRLANHKQLPTYPGVYILAHSAKNLENNVICVKDIFYVGMSNSKGGIKQRVAQFVRGLGKKETHSAAKRFIRNYNADKLFLLETSKKQFFVATLTLPCDVNKEQRTASDLKKMGKVAKLEYDVLAYVKNKLGQEPELNKK